MRLWYLTTDAPRVPERVRPGEQVALWVGTWPIEPAQAVWGTYQIEHSNGAGEAGRFDATWQRNEGVNSYWRADLGPFSLGDRVTYTLYGRSPDEEISGPATSLLVGPKLFLALLWHQHQPLYKDTSTAAQQGSYLHPWVRLHAIRDYYSMAALVAAHPGVHLTINLTPVLVWQLEDYVARGATDRALELTLKPAEVLSTGEQEQVLSTFFDAHWHHQIFPHERYQELFLQRQEGHPFTAQDLRDLQMWFNLAWFAEEFREGAVPLVTGKTASVQRFVEQGRDFSVADIEAMVAEQYQILEAVLPIHRTLQERGQIEVSTTPFSHPILPLLVDTDTATIDRPGARHPRRFAHPEDAEVQVHLALDLYQRAFGCLPRGMWPAEGAVSQAIIPLFARRQIQWIATDQGVLARSGRWGYRVEDPAVLCQPYRAEEGGQAISVFFRDTRLSDAIGFRYAGYEDSTQAARDFVTEIKDRFVRLVTGAEDRVLPVILDGENAWGAYREDARPFLHALYGLLEADPEVGTVTFAEYLEGNASRGVGAHPLEAQPTVYDLFTGSWIDENGSAPGVDLGTWIGEEEENRAWEVLGLTRDFLQQAGVTPQTAPAAFEALYTAEGSDWFWWFGSDQESGNDEEFDHLFRLHLKQVYLRLASEPPAALDWHIVPTVALWTFTRPISSIQPGDRLAIRTNCPGTLTWWTDGAGPLTTELQPVGGVLAGVRRYQMTLGPFSEAALAVHFRFHCTHPDCPGRAPCCAGAEQRIQIIR